jgi:hypothetical protein
MGKFVALKTQRIGDKVYEEGDVMNEPSTWPWWTKDRYILAGQIEYVPDKGEHYTGPYPNTPYIPTGHVGTVTINNDTLEVNAMSVSAIQTEDKPEITYDQNLALMVPEGNRALINNWVGKDLEKAKAVIAVEESKTNPRVTVIADMEAIIDSNNKEP